MDIDSPDEVDGGQHVNYYYHYFLFIIIYYYYYYQFSYIFGRTSRILGGTTAEFSYVECCG